MSIMKVFMSNTASESLLDASNGTASKPAISNFLTIQSFMNFAAMTGAITSAWNALQILMPWTETIWVPYLMAFAWAIISFGFSIKGLKKNGEKPELATLAAAAFLAFINALVLAGAVVGTNIVTNQIP